MKASLPLLLGGSLLAFGLLGAAVYQGRLPGMAASQGEGSSGGIRVEKPFTLTSHKGEAVSPKSLAGTPYLAFLGFTNCPDICPTTLFELTELMAELGPVADRFRALFITADPERDTQDVLAQYMTAFDPRILALRGTPEQTAQAIQAFGAQASKVPLEGGGYTMEHTAGVFLVDAQGRLKGVLDMHEPRATRLQKLRNLAADPGTG